MRRHPGRDALGTPPPGVTGGPPIATELGDAQEAWLVSGGWVFHPFYGEGFTTGPAGYQLLCYQYVPAGFVGWVKQLRVAPYMPSVLAQPWVTSGAVGGAASWVGFDASLGDLYDRPAGQNGVWTTPFGWEGYFDAQDLAAFPPQWRWQMTLVQGDVARIRAQLPPYSVGDPQSWQFVPNIPVPAAAYPQGLPGTAPGKVIGAQRMQVIQSDELTHHVMVPQDTSVCLWARWTQGLYTPRGQDQNGSIVYGSPLYPVGPSFGQLSGYMQALSSLYIDKPTASVQNARFGWGG
jgi:hypothetical protein